ncbi:hypothetical protein EBT16_13295 [bacterium]|nr:hypothetical protein [bacterium]
MAPLVGSNQLPETIVNRIRELMEDARAMPIYVKDGWTMYPGKVCYHFLEYILKNHLSDDSISAITEYHWEGDVASICDEIKDRNHPITVFLLRDYNNSLS